MMKLKLMLVLSIVCLAANALGLDVILNSNLTAGLTTYPQDMVVFICTTWGSGILNWFSDEYIGTDGLRLQLIAAGNRTRVQSNSDPNTVAIRINVTEVNGVILITSELSIITSPQHPMATVSCDNSDEQLRQSITFKTITNTNVTNSKSTTKESHEVLTTKATIQSTISNDDNMLNSLQMGSSIGLVMVIIIMPLMISLLVVLGIIIHYSGFKICGRPKRQRERRSVESTEMSSSPSPTPTLQRSSVPFLGLVPSINQNL